MKLEQLKAAYEAATQGEWESSRHATPEYTTQFGIYAEDATNDLAIVRGEANTQFIALAHNAMPLLLEVVRWADATQEWATTCFPEYADVEVVNELKAALEELK